MEPASAAAADTDADEGGSNKFEEMKAKFDQKLQVLLDKSTVHVQARWAVAVGLLLLYLLRVYLLSGWFIVTYGLGIYLLNLFIGFLSPQIDPETDGPLLPTSSSEEFRPFTRRVPEFKFWWSTTKATLISFFMTFFQFFNVPVFWPILLVYFVALFALTMKRQIKHMWKHNYVPWSRGKTRYGEDGDAAPAKPVAD